MVSYLGAFPFSKDAPAILGFEEMVIVVVIMTERYGKVLKNGKRNRNTLLYRSLSVYERDTTQEENDKALLENSKVEDSSGGLKTTTGFAVDQPSNGRDDNDDDDDHGLALAALEFLDAMDVVKHSDAPPISQALVPVANFKKLVTLLLLIASLEAQQSLSDFHDQLTLPKQERLRSVACSIVASFLRKETDTGIKVHAWNTVIASSMPFLFYGFNALFEHFLFSKNLDFTKHKEPTTADVTAAPPAPSSPIIPHPPIPPLLEQEGEVLDLALLSQLSFFIPGSSIFRRLRLLYSGGDAGFSMRSFETKVFNWRAPSILLISGSLLTDGEESGPERAFEDMLPPRRFSPSGKEGERVVFGVYVSQPWKQTYKECMGDSSTILFQLEPRHEVFRASTVNTDHISFTKSPISHPGINIGSTHPKSKQHIGPATVNLGPVSLYLDDSFEFGVFTHNCEGGGAFHQSATTRRDWQDRFSIESLEVWGCGGSEEAEEQRKRWAWEEREAEARRKVNLGTGDMEADRALLEMAGIIGGNRSGGSMS